MTDDGDADDHFIRRSAEAITVYLALDVPAPTESIE